MSKFVSAFPEDLCCYADAWVSAPDRASGRRPVRRHLLRLVGSASIAAAVAGVFLPLLPTTPFLLVAAWCFARSSPRLDAWLRAHPRFGPLIRDWEERGAVPAKAKALAVTGMSASLAVMWFVDVRPAVLAVAAAFLAAVAAWLLSRPS